MSLSLLKDAHPETAIVLGSGLGHVVEAFGVETEVPYDHVPGLGATQVPGHCGRFILTKLEGKPLLIAQGRRHLYEGLSAREVTAGIRLMHELGVKQVVLTNAAGAIAPHLKVGGFMLISDHLNLLGQSPLTGGPHFQEMSTAYSTALRHRFQMAAARLQIELPEGVYAAVPGPQYETPAEIRMLRVLGADAVGMSTVPEVIQARALGMEVAAISMLSNWAAGLDATTLDHTDVVRMGQTASERLADLLKVALA